MENWKDKDDNKNFKNNKDKDKNEFINYKWDYEIISATVRASPIIVSWKCL